MKRRHDRGNGQCGAFNERNAEMPFAEIAAELGVTPQRVMQILKTALEKVRASREFDEWRNSL